MIRTVSKQDRNDKPPTHKTCPCCFFTLPTVVGQGFEPTVFYIFAGVKATNPSKNTLFSALSSTYFINSNNIFILRLFGYQRFGGILATLSTLI